MSRQYHTTEQHTNKSFRQIITTRTLQHYATAVKQ